MQLSIELLSLIDAMEKVAKTTKQTAPKAPKAPKAQATTTTATAATAKAPKSPKPTTTKEVAKAVAKKTKAKVSRGTGLGKALMRVGNKYGKWITLGSTALGGLGTGFGIGALANSGDDD